MENSMDDASRRIGDNLAELREEIGGKTRELRDAVGSYVDEHPVAALGIAFGVGYLLSGALFSSTTFKAAAFGGRFALGGVLKQLIAGVGPGLIAAVMSGREGGEQPQGPGGNGNANRM